MTEHLDVFLHDDHIGVITPNRRDRRQVTFAIDSSYVGAPGMLTEGFSLVPGTKADTRHASNFFGKPLVWTGPTPLQNFRIPSSQALHPDPPRNGSPNSSAHSATARTSRPGYVI